MTHTRHLVTCKTLTQRFVVHDHALFGNTAQQLEQSLVQKFGWVEGAWVDTDAPRQITVKFAANDEIRRASEDEQREAHLSLIDHTLRFITWKPENTYIMFDNF